MVLQASPKRLMWVRFLLLLPICHWGITDISEKGLGIDPMM